MPKTFLQRTCLGRYGASRGVFDTEDTNSAMFSNELSNAAH